MKGGDMAGHLHLAQWQVVLRKDREAFLGKLRQSLWSRRKTRQGDKTFRPKDWGRIWKVLRMVSETGFYQPWEKLIPFKVEWFQTIFVIPHFPCCNPTPTLLSLGRFFQKMVWAFYALMGLKHFAAAESHVRFIKSTWRVLSRKSFFSECQMPQPMLSTSKKSRNLVIRSCQKNLSVQQKRTQHWSYSTSTVS